MVSFMSDYGNLHFEYGRFWLSYEDFEYGNLHFFDLPLTSSRNCDLNLGIRTQATKLQREPVFTWLTSNGLILCHKNN